MRRFDKITNINKVNILAEQRYFESKGLLVEELVDDINKLKSSLLNSDLVTFYETPISYKFNVNGKMNLYDGKGVQLPKIDLELRFGESDWVITKHYSTPSDKLKSKILLSTNNIDDIIKTMGKVIKYINKNKHSAFNIQSGGDWGSSD